MATVRRENGDLTPQEKKEVQAVFDHACTWQEKLETLAEDFDKKGYFGLMWDSKVPEKDRWFFYFFTFRSSNKDDVNAEIQKYLDFYREMSEIANRMMNNSEETSQRDKDACQLVKELREHLMKLSRAAESGEETTDSSTVYRLHREFIDKHEKLEHLIKKVECVALKQSREMAMEQSQKKIEQLETDLKKTEDKFKGADGKNKRLTTELTEVKNEKRTLEQANDLMEEQNRLLLENNKEQKKQREDLARANQRLESGQQQQSEEIDQLRGQLSNMSINQAEELESLRREKRELEERNERLEQERRDQARAIQELSEKQEEMFRKNEMVWKMLKEMQDERSGS